MEEKSKKEVKQIKLLCVDDEAEIIEFLGDYFSDKGYESYTADSGEKALEILREYNPNIVLLDVRLSSGGMRDGVQVLQEIKKYNPEIKVIMVTAVVDQPVIDKAKELGASDYITKPLNLEYLDTVVMEKIQEALTGDSKKGG
ncbi:MAG TPA: response regulator [Candidatus Omnitrophota bacterium]|nr:response regulator [Candidatus Omnitrophota bacterium]